MTTPSVRVGCVRSGSPSAEQQAAYDWCERTFPHTERFPMGAFADRDRELSAYDVCWWHTDEPMDPNDLDGCRGAIEAYLDEGGALLLSLHALTAVSELGIDPVSPDAVGIEHPSETTGYLLKSLHAEHPAFEVFDDLRLETARSESRQPFARYERLVPEEADVLACAYRDGDVPAQKTLLSWDRGPGTVLGAGAALAFDSGVVGSEGDTHGKSGEHGRNRSRLVERLLRFLAGDEGAALTTRPRGPAAFARVRSALRADPNRPSYHLTPPANWLNDPNGLIHYGGEYHVFYQYNPAGPFHGTIHWGHAASDDLIHWEDRPVALSPSSEGPDRDGCWSGCTVLDGETPTILYTGGRDQRQLPCLATTSDPTLDTWEKHEGNPIIEHPPEGLDLLSSDHWEVEFRDHCVWHEEGTWCQLIGSGITDVGGTVLLYESSDLREWHFRGPILTGDWDGAGHIWECPELLDLGDKQLLHVSNYEAVPYFLGHLDEDGFQREDGARNGNGNGTRDGHGDADERGADDEVGHTGLLDYGDFYAPQSMRTEDGRLLTWGWIIEARPPERQWDAGWSGALSLPRELSLSPKGTLEQRPARELRDLRGEHVRYTDLTPGADPRTLDVSGTTLELRADVDLAGGAEFGLVVRESPDGEERTVIRCVREDEGGALIVERSESSADPETASDAHRMPVDFDGMLDLHVFLDGSVVEVFANERRCLTSRVYPTRPDAEGVSVYAVEGRATLERFDAWTLEDAWQTGRTSEPSSVPR